MANKAAIARAYLAARWARKPRRAAPCGPVCDERAMAAEFEKFNVLGVGLDEARRLARVEMETGKNPHPGYSFGLSTGTMGEPGVFLTNEAERDRWLGTILGRYLKLGQLASLHAALLLKHNNRLYAGSSRVHYFDISEPANHWAPRLCDLAPNVLIGPPSVLLAVAESSAFLKRPFQPHTVIAGAEPLFPQDRERLRRAYHSAPRTIYQAKEGFLAAGCREGALHWNEDLMQVEWMYFRGRPERAVPVITDFTRESQRFERYRIDDVVLCEESGRCACGSQFARVTAVEGRLHDVILLPGARGGYDPLFPLEVNRVLQAAGEYTLVQHDGYHFTLAMAKTPPPEVLAELAERLRQPSRLELVPLRPDAPGRKRRRVQRLFDPGNEIILETMLEPL